MDTETYQMHLVAGRIYGPDTVCGTKLDYRSEERAKQAAEDVSVKYARHLEAYPCTWCGGWHVGRAFTTEEVERFTKIVREVSAVRDL